MTETERRDLRSSAEVRTRGDSKAVIAGYGVVFDRISENLGGFVEEVKPSAVTKTIKESDVRGMVNHDPNWILGRTGNGTMRISADSAGLEYEIDVNLRDPDGIRAVEKIEAGLLDGSSFGFRKISDEWGFTDRGFPRRTLHEVQIRDMGPATFPAYQETTSIAKRAMSGLAERFQLPAEEIVAMTPAELRSLFENADSRGVLPFRASTALPTDTVWDGAAEVARADTDDLRAMAAWYDAAEPDVKASYKLPHHRASESHPVVWRGVAAAMGALLGARGGVDIPAGDRRGVYNHLAQHYGQFNREPPEFRTWETEELRENGYSFEAEDAETREPEQTSTLALALRQRSLRERKYHERPSDPHRETTVTKGEEGP